MNERQPKIENIRSGELRREDRIALVELDRIIDPEMKNSPWKIDPELKSISIGQRHFYYDINIVNDKAYILIKEKVIRNEKVTQIVVHNRKRKLNSKKLKSKKGKTNIPVRTIIFMGTVTAVISAAVLTNNFYKDPKPEIETEFLTETEIPEVESMPNIVIETEAPIVETVPETIAQTEPIVEEAKEVFLNIDFNETDEYGYQKRMETEAKYGEALKKYTERYGLNYVLTVCQFTFERSNNPKHSENKRNNVGQLTQSIAGEVITAPVYQNGEMVGADKFYLLPSENSKNYNKIKKEGLELCKKDNSIRMYEWNSIYDPDTNIKLSSAFLAYMISRKDDLVRGVMSYNAGYGSVRDSYSYEDIFNGVVKVDDPKYWKHILQYLHSDEYEDGFDCLINGERYHYDIVEKENKLGAKR